MAKAKKKPSSTFTGMARTLVCYNHNGWPCYRIVSLIIENGVVMQEFKSQPFANFEAFQKLDLFNDYAQMRLNMEWEDGKALFLRKDKEGNLVDDTVQG